MGYSAFDISRAIGNKLSEGVRESRDENLIEKIIAETANNPEAMQDAMGKILSKVSPERQPMAINYLKGAYENVQAKQKQARERQAAIDAGLTPDLPAALQVEQYKAKQKENRMRQYGLAPGDQPAPNQIPPDQGIPGQPPVAGATPPTQNRPVSDNPMARFTEGQLVALEGSPDPEVQRMAKAERKRREALEKENREDKRRTREEEIEFHKESKSYDDELFKNTKSAKKQIEALKDIEKAIASGNVQPNSMANIFKGMGKIGDKISEALLNKDQAALNTAIPQLLEGWKEVFGVRLSDADLKILQDKMPSMGKSPEANRAITKILKKYSDMTLLRGRIAKEIKDNNKGLRPLGYADKIEERFDEMIKPVKLINPNNGREIEVPAYKVSEAIEAGATLPNEQL